MPRVWSQTDGFSVVEVLLAATIFGFIAVGVSGAIIYGRQSTAFAGEHARAAYIAEEGIEAIRNIKAAAYSNLANGTYGLAQSGGAWVISGTSDTTGIFTRQITIADGGANRKIVTASVDWPQGVSTAQTTIATQLTNWAAVPKSWPNAVLAGGYDSPGNGNGRKIATGGNYAYIVRDTGSPNFLIVDISNPASPALVGSMDLAGEPAGIFISGTSAYVTNTSNSAEMQIIDISNPAAPTLASSFDAPGHGSGLGIFVAGAIAYLSRDSHGNSSEFIAIDISNPAAPVQVGTYSNNINMNDVVVSGNYAYVGTDSSSQKVLVIDISTPSAPTLAAIYNPPASGDVNTLAINGTTLLIGQNATLTLVDIANPLVATTLGNVASTGSATINDIDVEPTGTYAFIATSGNTAEFQVANISNPTAPGIVRTVDIPGASSTLSGVAYSQTLDIVVGASASNTQEVVTFTKN